MIYSGFWRRLAAQWIDNVIIYLLFILTGLAIGWMPSGFFIEENVSLDTPSIVGRMFILVGIFVGIISVYYAWMESSKLQGTLGKLALGLIVVDGRNEPISFGRAMGRFWAKGISNLTFYIGYIMSGFTEQKQALHDMIAKTYVVDKNVLKFMKEPEAYRSAYDVTGQLPEHPRMLQAGFWKRLFAYVLVDYMILYILSYIITMFVMVFVVGVSMISLSDVFEEDSTMSDSLAVGLFLSYFGISFGLSLCISWVYYAVMESSSTRGTLGKMALGISVVNTTNEKVTFGRASARYWSRVLSGFTFGIGYIMAAFTKNKQGLHDILAKTYVVDNKILRLMREREQEGPPALHDPPFMPPVPPAPIDLLKRNGEQYGGGI